jgi:hypothetical protein
MSPTSQVPLLIQEIYQIVNRLENLFPGRPFTPDGHLVGSIGEVMAAHRYGLTLLSCSSECHDAIAPDGTMVQIKATQGRSVALRHEPHHLIVLKLGKNGQLTEAYNGPGELPWSMSGTLQKNGQRSISLAKLGMLMSDILEERRIRPAVGRALAHQEVEGASETQGGENDRGF